MIPIIAIVGPTAVGKTELGVRLAKALNGEIINADSMQVYRDLNIGTAKVTEAEKQGVPHHLFDICNVEDIYTVCHYQRDARAKIKELRSRGKTPIFVGGTGLYLKAALYDYEFSEEMSYDSCEDKTNEELYSFLSEKEKQAIHIHNRKRLIRAYNKQKNNTSHHNQGSNALYPFICIGLTSPREKLYDRINKRVLSMLENGLLEEVQPFHDKKIYSKAIQTGIGYKELYSYFDGTMSLEESISLIQKNSRHYAKRQYTFFERQLPVHWITTNYENFEETIQEAISYIESK